MKKNIEKQKVDLYELYKTVCSRGGYQVGDFISRQSITEKYGTKFQAVSEARSSSTNVKNFTITFCFSTSRNFISTKNSKSSN